MSERNRRIENLERRIKMLEQDERKHDLKIREHSWMLDAHGIMHEQHRAAIQPLIDERQADTVTITISRDYAKNMATWEPNWSIGFYDELCEVTEACRAALKETE